MKKFQLELLVVRFVDRGSGFLVTLKANLLVVGLVGGVVQGRCSLLLVLIFIHRSFLLCTGGVVLIV